MKYAAQMGSGAMIYIPSFIKTGSGWGRGVIQTAWQSHKLFFNSRLIIVMNGLFLTVNWEECGSNYTLFQNIISAFYKRN
jgi:hypothetical protein